MLTEKKESCLWVNMAISELSLLCDGDVCGIMRCPVDGTCAYLILYWVGYWGITLLLLYFSFLLCSFLMKKGMDVRLSIGASLMQGLMRFMWIYAQLEIHQIWQCLAPIRIS